MVKKIKRAIKCINSNEMFYKTRDTATKFLDDYSLIIFDAKHSSFHGKGLKILIPKYMV